MDLVPSTSWIQLLKRISKEEREASKPCTTVLGVVVSVEPLKIKVNQKLTISNNFLIIPQHVKPLELNDNVLMIRQDGGQKYSVVGKL